MKTAVSLLLAICISLAQIPASAFGIEQVEEPVSLSAQDAQDVDVSFENPSPVCDGDFSESDSQEESVELMATESRRVACSRKISVTASSKSPAYLYLSSTTTEKTKNLDRYDSNVTLYVTGYVVLSDGTWRYYFNATSSADNQNYTFYLPASNKTSELEIYHTKIYASAHPHTITCQCGGLSQNSYSSSCIQCNNAHIYYNANGGSGAPSSQTVSSDSVTLSTTVPNHFPYLFAGWGRSSGSSSPYYYSGEDLSPSAGSSTTLYAVWKAAANLGTYSEEYSSISSNGYAFPGGITTSSASIFNKGSIAYFAVTPVQTATYTFESTNSSGDTIGYLYNSGGTQLSSDDDGGEGSNFRLSDTLTAGTTYYYGVKWYSNSKTGTINVKLRQQYTISYDANGGTGAPSSQSKLYGDTLTLSSIAPVRDPFLFAGWSETSGGEAEYSAGGTYTGNADTTLFAVWGDPSGACGDQARWTLRDGCLSISGSGPMEDYASTGEVPWAELVRYIHSIEISDDITAIGSYAFADCAEVPEITLPESVRSIGAYAFSNCAGLKRCNGAQYAQSVGESAFRGCAGLEEITLSQAETLGACAFCDCALLRSAVLSVNLGTLPDSLFAGCAALEEVNLPAGLRSIGANAFSGDENLNQIALPGTLTEIQEFAFANCRALQEIVIPGGVTSIGRGAFSNCSALRTATIPDGVVTIGTSIFAYIKDQVTVRCYVNTPIYSYAVENGIRYELMSWGKLESPAFIRKDASGGVTIEMTAAKGDIHYTTDNTVPTAASALYTAPIFVQKNVVIQAIAVCEGWDNSAVAVLDTNIGKVSSPVASLPSGSKVTAGTAITLSSATEGAAIWYTTNGNVPTAENLYTGPIAITEDTTILALAVKDGMLNSTLSVFTYTVTTQTEPPVITTLEATDVTATSARISAAIENTDVALVRFLYYEKNNSAKRYLAEADENHSALLTGLSPGTEYWYQARAVNDDGWISGYICSFVTEEAEHTRPTSIEITPSYVTLNAGKSKTLLATVLPMASDSRKVFWSSENTDIVTVDSSGVVTAVGPGTTRIKATAVSNKLAAYCTVSVVSTEITGSFDFSEINMAARSSHYDPHGYNYTVNDGGNALMASAYLARWDGVVPEEADPYPASSDNVGYHPIEASYHVQKILYLPYRQDALDNSAVKSAVMQYGAVYTAMKINNHYFSQNKGNYYLPPNVNKVDGGHAVAIVGWDDNYPKSSFDTPPAGDGAFICKNSWGTEVGDKGYFYVSYYDKTIARKTCGDYNAVFLDLQHGDNYNKIYQYDYLGPVASTDLGRKSAYTANVFPEAGSALSQDEILEAVSFYNYAPGTDYEIYIVPNYTDAGSLRNLGTAVETGSLDYAGYFTVDLDKPVRLSRGTRFAVVVKYSTKADTVSVFVELPVSGRSDNARANSDESYISPNGESWTDFTRIQANANLCIKAFTKTGEAGVLLQGIDNPHRESENDTVASLDELLAAGFQFNSEFIEEYRSDGAVRLLDESEDANFGFLAPSVLPDLNTNNNYAEGNQFPGVYDLRKENCVTPVRNQGALGTCWCFATYASLESAVMKASASAVSHSADGLSQAGSGSVSLALSEELMVLAAGATAQLIATLTPYDSARTILWKSSDSQVASVSPHGIVTAVGTGNATITATTEDGAASAQCRITVKEIEPLRSVSIDNAEPALAVGEELLMQYSYSPSNASDPALTWESSDEKIASVDAYGLVTARRYGTVTITAVYPDGTEAGSHQIIITDGQSFATEVIEDSLEDTNGSLRGSLALNVSNREDNSRACTVFVALYAESGRLLSLASRTVTAAPGDNRVDFPDLRAEDPSHGEITVKIFTLAPQDGFVPLNGPVTN